MIHSANMTPALSGKNAAHLGLTNAKFFSDFTLRHLTSKGFDFGNLLVAQFGAAMQRAFVSNHKAAFISVQRVFLCRHPFQVVSSVVRFVAIDVVDLVRWGRRRADKCSRNQTMHKQCGLLRIFAKRSPYITTLRKSRGQNKIWALNGPNASSIRNLIQGFKSCNRLPNLFHRHLQCLMPYLVPQLEASCNHYKGD